MAQAEQNPVEQLYIKHERQAFSVAYNVLHNRADAEDAVQQAFAAVIDRLPRLSLDSDDKSRALLMIITKNIAINMLRSRRRSVPLEDADNAAPLLTQEEFSSLRGSEIRAAISRLPEDIKHIIALRFVYGFTAEETAELTRLSLHAVYRKIRQARKLLKEYLEV